MVRSHHCFDALAAYIDGDGVVFEYVAVYICEANGAQLMLIGRF